MWKMTIAAIVATSCHASMMSDLDAMQGYVEDTRRETTRHLDASRAATTMDELRAEMDRHADGMGSMMPDIDAGMADMTSHCDGAGMADLRAMHGDLDVEIGQHSATMAGIGDMPAAMIEIERHSAAMMLMMDGMNATMANMTCW